MTQTQERPAAGRPAAAPAPAPAQATAGGWEDVRARLRGEVDELGAKAAHMALDGMKAGIRSAVAHPVEFAPLGVAAAASASAGVTDYTQFGWPTMVVLIGLAGWVLWCNATSRRARRAVHRWTRRAYYSLAATITIVYAIAAMVTGPFAAFAAELFGWATIALTVGWWLRDGRRPWRRTPAEPQPEPAPLDEEAERKRRLAAAFLAWWSTDIAVHGGAVYGSRLIDVDCDEEADRATIDLTDSSFTQATVRNTKVQIAKVRGISADLVDIGPLPGRREDRARVEIYRNPPLVKPRVFTGPQLDYATGKLRVAQYADRSPATVKWWQPGSGTWNEMVSGAPGSGKSRYLDLALAAERHSTWPGSDQHLVVSWAADPQKGQSLPEWQKALDQFYPSAEGGLEMLEEIYEEMLARNDMLAGLEWKDEQGRTHPGMSYYDPVELAKLGVYLPILSGTLEEAHNILTTQRAVWLTEQILKMDRKCGIRLRVVTQVPSIIELGGSFTIRPLLASMNIVCLRTADKITDNSFNLPGDPADLEAEFEDGSTTAGLGYIGGGSARPAKARIELVEDPYHWANTGTTGHLQRLAKPRKRAAKKDQAAGAPADTVPASAAPVSDQAPADQAPAQDADQAAAQDGPINASARDKILALLREQQPKPLTSGLLAAQGGLPPSTVSQTLKRMTTAGLVVKLSHGVYALPGSDTAAYFDSDASAA